MEYWITATSGTLEGQAWRVEGDSLVIGRGLKSTILVNEAHVSRAHARISCGPDGSGIVIEDLGSLHGTFIGKERSWKKISTGTKVPLRDGAGFRLTVQGPEFVISCKESHSAVSNDAQYIKETVMDGGCPPPPQIKSPQVKIKPAGRTASETGDLLAEFSELISSISSEVIQQATYATALQEMKQVNSNLSSLQASLPRSIKEVEAAGIFFGQIKNEVRQLLDKSAQNIAKQDAQLAKQLVEISDRYRQLADSLLSSHQQALAGQTRQIQRNTDETIEQVHAAIVESQRGVSRQLDRVEKALEAIRVQAQEGNVEMGRMMQRVEADLAQAINCQSLQLHNSLTENHRRLCWLAIGNLVLLMGTIAGIMAPYLK